MQIWEVAVIVCSIVIAAVVVSTVTLFLVKRCNRTRIQNDNPCGSSNNLDTTDVEAQRGTDNVNNFGNQVTRTSSINSNKLRQQILSQQIRPSISEDNTERKIDNVKSFGNPLSRTSSVNSSKLRQQILSQQIRPSISDTKTNRDSDNINRFGNLFPGRSTVPPDNPRQQNLPQQTKQQASDVEAQRGPQIVTSLWHEHFGSQSIHSGKLEQKNLPQQNKQQLRVSSSATRLSQVNIVQPSYRQQGDAIFGHKSTQYAKLDLHYFTLKNAMGAFKTFLNESIIEYTNNQNSRKDRFIEVITGRGKHSPGGIPVIKPAVENYLIKHGYKFVWANPGMVRIDLRSIIEDDYD